MYYILRCPLYPVLLIVCFLKLFAIWWPAALKALLFSGWIPWCSLYLLSNAWVLKAPLCPSFYLCLSRPHIPHGAGPGVEGGGVPAQEEGEEDISGTQFVCETVIRSMTLEEAPDHAPLKVLSPGTGKDQSPIASHAVFHITYYPCIW